MDVRIRTTALSALRDDAVVLTGAKGESLRARVAAVGRAFLSPYAALGERKLFEGGDGQVQSLHAPAGSRVKTLVLAGLGPAARITAETLRRAAASGVRAAREQGAKSVSVALPSPRGPAGRPDRAAEAVVEGALLGLYRFETYRTEKSKTDVETLSVLVPARAASAARRGLEEGRILAEAVCFARTLGNEPSNVATPTYLAERAQEIAKAHGLDVQVLEEADMRRLGMGSLLGVAQGSAQPPKLIVLTYEPKRKSRGGTVALVGKGITFDTGGISIKPAAKMEDMKFDMCGGAAVLATVMAAARLKLRTRVVGVVPTTENMPGGKAYKPGDILKAMNGVTIEVKNTDAEGRLILADGLAYATSKLRPRPRVVVDMATLTGACSVALGDQFAAVVSTDDRLAERILEASEASGDPAWRLPLVDGYRRQMDSVYADISNLGSPGAGVQTGAAFLERFAGKVPWAHIDIASVAWTEKDGGMLRKGATGFGVRLMTRFLQAFGR